MNTIENQYQWMRPKIVLKITTNAIPIFFRLSQILLLSSLIYGLYILKEDYQQGEHFKMIFIHVPFAWACMVTYSILSLCSIAYLITSHPLLVVTNRSLSQTGALFTFCCLITGCLWGFPTWGTFWVWDARLTSVLILLFIYLIHILLVFIGKDKIASIFSVIGLINLPIIKYSVEWWNTLHQGASITQSTSSIHESVLIPMLLIFVSFLLYLIIMVFISLREYINSIRSQSLL